MLFMVIGTHTAENCPALAGGQQMEDVKAAVERSEELAKKLGVKIHFSLTGAPDHVFYSLVEGDSLAAIEKLVFDVPIRQEYRVVPVHPIAEALP